MPPRARLARGPPCTPYRLYVAYQRDDGTVTHALTSAPYVYTLGNGDRWSIAWFTTNEVGVFACTTPYPESVVRLLVERHLANRAITEPFRLFKVVTAA